MVPGLCAEQAGTQLVVLLSNVPSACRHSFSSEVKSDTSVCV